MNVEPLTPQRFPDLATLFGPNGANSGCWCMWWRIPAKEWTANGNAGNRTAFEAVVRRGEPTLRLDPADRIWAVTCFYIHRHHRRAGVAAALLDAAVAAATALGAAAVEGYPVDTQGERRPSGDLFTGTVALFAGAGFTVHSRPTGGRRVVMRRRISR